MTFALSDASPKASPALIGRDEEHFSALARSLEHQIADLAARIDAERRAPGGSGRQAMDRDMEIHRLTARLRVLQRFGLDTCLGRMVTDDAAEPVYVGRVGLTDSDGRRLLVDWRSPAAEPFFAATHADPMGLVSRRRYRWSRGRVSDYWDEVFSPGALEGHAALDDQSAFIASLGASRSSRMRDVLGTIAADQDAVIRAGSDGALVVDGGPGTGKTVVALHRAAYLIYSDPRLGPRRGGVLFVGPHRHYLAYVADVLPSLGEHSVQTCTLDELVPEGAAAPPETNPLVAQLKSSADMVAAIEPAVGLYEEPPSDGLLVETPWSDVWLSPTDWADAFASPGPGTPHNEARDQVWEALVGILLDRLREARDDDGWDPDTWAPDATGTERNGWDDEDDGDEFDAYGITSPDPDGEIRSSLSSNRELTGAFARAWPLLEASDIVADLWSVPAYLRMCAPWLTPTEVSALQRPDARGWTDADLPLLDAARHRLGDPAATRRRRRQEAAAAADHERMSDVVADLISGDDSEMGVMSMLRGQDLRAGLVDDAALPVAATDHLGGPFAHIIVDEAQELTEAQWQMLLRRCPSKSLTIVGDRAQAREGFTESWQERLEKVGLSDVRSASLNVNYRTPQEVMEEARPVIAAVVPDANVPASVRRSGIPVHHGSAAELSTVLETWLAAHDDGTACVIGDPTFKETPRVRSLAPEHTKGLEFDLVVLVDPEAFAPDTRGAVDRYVAMTRATQQLVVLTSP